METNTRTLIDQQQLQASLERLGTEYLDVYLLHWPGPHPLEDTVAAFEAHWAELRASKRVWNLIALGAFTLALGLSSLADARPLTAIGSRSSVLTCRDWKDEMWAVDGADPMADCR